MREEPDYNTSKLKNEKTKYKVISVLSAIAAIAKCGNTIQFYIESCITVIIEVNIQILQKWMKS